jgi:hypothetical protein
MEEENRKWGDLRLEKGRGMGEGLKKNEGH